MATSDALAQVRLGPDDIGAAQRLSDEAGWNQTGDDWRVFITQGDTIGIHDLDKRLIASAAALPYGGEFGFVAMVLVTASWRRKGLATRLLHQCVCALQERGLVPVLDATPAGALVYRQQGFVEHFGLNRWECPHMQSRSEAVPRNVRAATADDLERMVALDAAATGADRPFLLADFLAREGSQAFVTKDDTGFSILRRGRRAWQIGPIVAAQDRQAMDLLGAACSAAQGAVFIDVPVVWTQVARWLSERGFSVQRSFSRMALGATQPFGNPGNLFAAAGPEFG